MAKKNASNKVESIRHKDKRKNIPTEELRDFVAEDENAPKTMLYPRDPSLDPQLVWKGKDEQDGKDLAVPVVPIYIQEKIHPQAIIDQLPRLDHSGGQLDLFADFNGLPEAFDQRVDFYHHEGNWSNRMILGDSLLVMTSLAEKEGLKGNVIIENLIKAGVQNTVKNERLKFDRLEVHPGVWIHAEGQYTAVGAAPRGRPNEDGQPRGVAPTNDIGQPVGAGPRACPETRRVAVCIGPEHGTVGPELVKEAAKEAVQGIGFDLLLVCGFAFDPHVSEEAKRYGKLTVLPVRMNPDLSMGEDLLKKTGAGNLFMVFGEPDVEIRKVKGGQIVVEIKGVDVYDPTTGAIRSSSTDDIACWFIDTNYNQESFFVRHAYFTGAEEPYEKLKRALRAEIDEAAWSELYSTTSRPFDPPEKGKIAVKVINHYGDEVLKVYEVKSKK